MKRPALSIALAALLALIFLGQGLHAPFEKEEEARPASIVGDILRRGDWLLPQDIYGEVTRKPPLYYWLSAAALRVRHQPLTEAGARAVSIVAAAALAALVVGLANAQFEGAAGLFAFLFLLGSYGFAAHAAYARTDMLFTLFLFAAYCLLYRVIEGTESIRYWGPAGVLLGLAILTKGPLALVLCTLATAVYVLLVGRNPLKLLLRPGPWMVLAVAVALAAAWYVPALLESRGALATVQLREENLGHFLPGTWGGTGEAARPAYYIALRFLGESLPFGLYIPALFVLCRRVRELPRPVVYQLALLIAVLGFFSLASSKRDDYILPAFPPFAMLLAAMFTSLERKGPSAGLALRNVTGALAALGMLALALAGIVLSLGNLGARLSTDLQSSDAAYLRLFLGGFRHGRQALLTLTVIICSAGALIAWWRQLPKAVAVAVALASLAGVSLWLGTLRPGLAAQRSFKTFATAMRTVTADQPVFGLRYASYELSYYYGKPILPLPEVSNAGWGRYPHYLLIWSDQLELLGDRTGAWQMVLSSHYTYERHRLDLLKLGPGGFETPLKKNSQVDFPRVIK